MFKSTENYNIYTSEDKNNVTFIAVINKQNNRLMCAYTHTDASGIVIEILSNGPISRYEKYVGKYANHQLMFDEDIKVSEYKEIAKMLEGKDLYVISVNNEISELSKLENVKVIKLDVKNNKEYFRAYLWKCWNCSYYFIYSFNGFRC